MDIIETYEKTAKDVGAEAGGGRMPTERIREAIQTLKDYQVGKKNLEARIVENEKWFRAQHWKNMRQNLQIRQTGWLFAAIVNKHADFMDNKPEVNVLAREPDDETAAKNLTSILPVVLRRGGWEDAYEEYIWDKLKFGGGILQVTWDPVAYNGLGDVNIRAVDALNLFWEPGVEDIQKSRNVFCTQLVSNETLRERFPGNKELERLGNPDLDVQRYAFDESISTDGYSYVVDWYYKKPTPTGSVLHYCQFVEDICLFSSEYDGRQQFAEGWYRHGKYPFVFDSCFPDKGTPYGFGFIDVMKDTQEDIDEANDLMMRNMKQAARRRYFTRNEGGVNLSEFADYTRDFVHVAGSLNEDNIKEITAAPLPASYQNMLAAKVDELKENSFNRDVNSGGTGGTTTASGIAALQEAGSKSSRDIIARTYRAFRTVCEIVIELLRQFYTVPRYFRILGPDRQEGYAQFDNGSLQAKPIAGALGVDFGTKEPVFDLDVRVSKQNVWSRTAQNQDVINFYGMGFFDPLNAEKSLAALEVLELDNKDKLVDVIRRGSVQAQFNAQVLPQLLQLAQQAAPQLGAAAMQAAAAAGLISAPAGAQTGNAERPAETDSAGGVRQANSYMDKQRQIAADRTAPR